MPCEYQYYGKKVDWKNGGDLSVSSAWVGQNYPNPFSGQTDIDYELSAGSDVILTVTDLTGRKVMEVKPGQMPAGKHKITLKTSNLEAGIYTYTLRAGSVVLIKLHPE